MMSSKIIEKLQHLAVPIEALVPDPANPRQHPERNIEAIKASLLRFGQRQPLVVQKEGMIVRAGNGRLEAAKALGWTEIAAVVIEEDDITATAYAIADNRTSDLADWDHVALSDLLVSLGDGIESTGFTTEERDDLLRGGFANKDIDDGQVDDPAESPIVQAGEVWICGRHRVLCGDATSEADVEKLLNGAVPFLCVTDPPYGVNYDPAWRNEAAAKGHLAYAPSRVGKVANDDRADWSAAWKLFPGDVIYSWHPAGATSLVHAAALQVSDFDIRMQIIWAKSNFPIGRGDYHVKHEPCWYAVRSGKAARRTDDRTQTTLWEINLDKNVEGGHSTQKPIECMARPIRNHAAQEVYDPFIGSGTTLAAAEQLDCTCYGIDIEPRYVQVAIRRWRSLTGEEPVREGDGKPLAELEE